MRSLKRQDQKYELIVFDNQQNRCSSAAEAFNQSAQNASGDYLLFIHQDVYFSSPSCLKLAEDYLSTLDDVGLAGFAGMKKPGFVNQFEFALRYALLVGQQRSRHSLWYQKYGRGTVFHGQTKQRWEGRFVFEPEEVQTVDELALVIPERIFHMSAFDEVLCRGWHLYGVDFALRMAQNRLKTYVLPFTILHRSSGIIDKSYRLTLLKLLEKYVAESVVNTTCGCYPTERLLTQLLWKIGANPMPTSL